MGNHSRTNEDDHRLHVQQQFMQHQQALLAYILSLVPHLPDAQDILQEVFLVVSRKAATWAKGTNFLAWACSIARFEILNYTRFRKQAFLIDHDVLQLPEQAEPSFDEFQTRLERLTECLKQLSPRARELILLRYHSSQMPEDIAISIHWSVNAVRVALTRARQSLKTCLEQRLRLEDNS